MTKITAQRDLSSKPGDLKLEVIVEDEPVNDKREDAQTDSFISVQVKKAVDVTQAKVFKESDKRVE